MTEITARISDAIVDLNSLLTTISDNDTLEFNVDNRLNVLETAVDDLRNDVEETIELTQDTSE